MGSVDGEETSRDSDTSPNYSRVETEAANMLGNPFHFVLCIIYYILTQTFSDQY